MSNQSTKPRQQQQGADATAPQLNAEAIYAARRRGAAEPSAGLDAKAIYAARRRSGAANAANSEARELALHANGNVVPVTSRG